MLYIVKSFVAVFGFVMVFTNLCHHMLVMEAHRKALNQKFDAWWQRAKVYDRVRLALVFAKGINKILDSTFGKKLISTRVILKCSILSSGLLLLVLSVSGLRNAHPFGAAPWKAYAESAKYILATTDALVDKTNYATFTQVNLVEMAPKINVTTNLMLINMRSNYFMLTMSTNGVYDVKKFSELGNGGVWVSYTRRWNTPSDSVRGTNVFGDVTTYSNILEQLITELTKIHSTVAKYNTQNYLVLYSICFYVVLFLVNTLLFIASLAFGRTILREIARAKKGMTIAALVFTNVSLVLVAGGFLLLLLTFLAIPMFWLLVPTLYAISVDSLYSILAFLSSSALALIFLVGNSTRLVLCVAFLPCLIALAVGGLSLIAVKWRNGLHFVVKNIVIRCAEKSPYAVLAFVIGCVVWLIMLEQKFFHFF